MNRGPFIVMLAGVAGVATCSLALARPGEAAGEKPPASFFQDVAWSSDGKRVAFASDRDGNDDIYVANADGSTATRLTHDAGKNSAPSWSSNGKRIAFSSNRDGHWQIYAMNDDGSAQTRLTKSEANCSNPQFSPDGSKIVFYADNDGPGVEQHLPFLAARREEGRLFCKAGRQ